MKNKLHRVTELNTNMMNAAYCILSGDTRIPENEKFNHKRNEPIHFISENGESEEFIIDLRANNGTEECFQDWVTFSNEYIGGMDTGCDNRRHSSQERVTQWIFIRHFTNEVCILLSSLINTDFLLTLFDCTGKKILYE